MREQIADYLAQGYSQEQTAQIVGVSASTISEYVRDEGFKELLKEKGALYQDDRINKKYSALEEKVLNQLTEVAKNGFAEVSDLCKILDAVSRNKHKNLPTGNLTNPTLGITLIMNTNSQPNVVLDNKNQVIEINGSTMKAMPIMQVKELFGKIERDEEKDKREKKEQEGVVYEQRAVA